MFSSFELRDQYYKAFFFITYGWFKHASVFVLGKPFQSCLMFVGKAGANPSEAPV
jgi:hypothetical protein